MTTLTREEADQETKDVDRVTIRFAGDSGDGCADGRIYEDLGGVGNNISTVPDIPAGIRAPRALPG